MVLQSQRGVEEPTGQSHTRPDAAGADVLSAREREVAALVATGMSNRAIAQALMITESAAEVHLKHILSAPSRKYRARVRLPWHESPLLIEVGVQGGVVPDLGE
jgi:DNA-binding NarL/FixJ family response regulator